VTAVTQAPTAWRERIQDAHATDAVLLATPFVAIVNGKESLWLLLPAALLALIVVPNAGVRRSPWPWLAVGCTGLVWDRLNWYGLDDHVILTHYWLLGVGCALFAADRERSLELNARLLIGLTFVLAIVSKIAWGEVLDGSVYRAIMLIDDRFLWVARAAGIDDPLANREQLERVHDLGSVTLDGGERATLVSGVLVGGTLLVESVLAVSFLAPLRGSWRWLRTASLATFCIMTYAIVPVAGFGALLLVMASAERRLSIEARIAHYVGAAALLVWVPLWSALQ
jgi:hypothetical protein